MISENEKKQLDRIQYEENTDEIISIAKASVNPFFLQECAYSYNWNDGMRLPTTIANNEHCDLGTALTLFWLAGGMSYFLREIERDEYNYEWADFCEMVIKKLTNNAYPSGQVSFKPNINKLTQYKYKKAGIPSVLYLEVKGAST